MTTDHAAALRTAFDRAFAEPHAAPRPPVHDFLRVRVGGQQHAIALTEISALHVDVLVAAIPSPAAELAGIAAIRGVLVPIFDLRVAIGAPVREVPRWSVVVRDGSAGFAFDGFEGHARTESGASGGGGRAVIVVDGSAVPLIGLGALLGAIRERWRTMAGRVGRPRSHDDAT